MMLIDIDDARTPTCLTLRAKFGTIRAVSATPLIRTRQMQLVEHAHGAPDEALLARLYVDEGLTQAEIAERLGVGLRSVVRWMATVGIPTRDRRALAASA